MSSEKSFKDQLVLDAENLTAGGVAGAALSTLANGINKALNHYTPQDYPIGELFAEHIINKNSLRTGPHFASYSQSFPRVMSELGGKTKNLLTDLISPLFAVTDTTYFEPNEINDLKKLFLEKGNNVIGREVIGLTPPDKISKVPGLLDKLKSQTDLSKATSELSSLLNKEYGVLDSVKSPAFLIESPRNNTTVLAHEFGHLFETVERNDFINSGTEPWRKLKEAWNFVHGDLGATRIDQSEVLPEKIRKGIADFKADLGKTKKGFILNSVLEGMMTTPMSLAITPVVSSKTVRDFIGGLDSSGNLQKAMDWVGDHNIAVATLASMPNIIHEAATIPYGYKAVTDFWKEFNKGEAGALAGSELLKKSAPLIGKKKPWLEGLKFLGGNALTLLPAFAPAIGAMVGNWITKDSEDK